MSEKIFLWLLQLYPARFRNKYGEAAIQLLQDRARDERGPWARLRFWSDVLLDLAASLPREYRHAFFAQTSYAEAVPATGAPAFRLLEAGPSRFGPFLFGGILSMVTLACFPALMNHFGYFRPSVEWTYAFQRAIDKDPSPREQQLPQPQQSPPDTRAAAQAQPSAEPRLDAATRHHIIQSTIAGLKQHLLDPVVAENAADALLAHERRGDDDAAVTPSDLASLLTQQIRAASDDHDVEMLYSARPIPERPRGPFSPPAMPAAYRDAMQRSNCAFEKVDMLPDNVGYIKLNAFPARSVCEATAVAAMERVNNANALIFDLRENRGGFDLGGLLAAYLFDHPEYWYSPIQETTRDSWTRSPVAGSRLTDKPVYVLTSSRTISAAEQFCFNLKMLKRATLVGETTAGGAHAANFHSVGDNFYLGTVDVRSINPYSKYDWNGTGVEPDVKVSAADALDTALRLARSRTKK